ncbi:spermidine/putrescine ABC transporter substrate-binding protein [Geovibrio thiophilus]|uniref:Spermidine/putrescine ABC transporter substrate-binding protein n=1 Tax=Geovibrio thiophilus TaxID=139438 RepID=A0A3R5V0L1_9BACT|nr:spermidine/putrescine ABC transporter substrate-binding protein [Geovibrio thiophilus]QAR32653.1 spermidine/putrescine ABC transporter substrate-binding protein [Geovibrio thiophilus]
MRKLVALMVLFLFCTGIASAAKNELRIFTWSEYMDEAKFAADFQAATGIKVIIDNYESNEDMLAKLQAGGVSQYDIIIPSMYVLPILKGLKLIQPINHSKIPNLKNLMPQFKKISDDMDNKYSAAWQWGTVGVMYNKEHVTDAAAADWSIVFDPAKQAKSFWLMDDIRSSFNQAFCYLGLPVNSTNPQDIKKAADLLRKVKNSKNCLGFKTGVGGKNDVVAGTADVAIVYNGDAMREVLENPKKFGYVVPKQGGDFWVDVMAVPAKAPNPEAAHKWINWILDPKIGAELSNYNSYATPNQASLPFIEKEQRENTGIYPSDDVMKKLNPIIDVGNAMRLYDEAWTYVKSR